MVDEHLAEHMVEPWYLWVLLRRLHIGEVDATLLGVASDTSPTEFVEQVSPAFGLAHTYKLMPNANNGTIISNCCPSSPVLYIFEGTIANPFFFKSSILAATSSKVLSSAPPIVRSDTALLMLRFVRGKHTIAICSSSHTLYERSNTSLGDHES